MTGLDGKTTGEIQALRYTPRPVIGLYAHVPVSEFGSLALRTVRKQMIRHSYCRLVINCSAHRIRRVFRWGVGHELVTPEIVKKVEAVEPLRNGRTTAPGPLPVAAEDATRFITCAHCGTNLEVKQTGSSRFTTILERLERNTEYLAGHLETIRLQNDLERLDREWDLSRRQYATPDKHGQLHYPGPAQTIGGFIGIGFGILWTIMACAITGSAPDVGPLPIVKVIFPLFGLLFIGAGIASMISSRSRDASYQSAQGPYYRKRQALTRQMQAVENNHPPK